MKQFFGQGTADDCFFCHNWTDLLQTKAKMIPVYALQQQKFVLNCDNRLSVSDAHFPFAKN